MGSIVAIVGRPNVGKSTLFNRLTGSRDAIVDEVSGVTRDRHYGRSEWNGVEFSLIDTGGYVLKSDDIYEAEIRKQVQLALEEADCILFVVDVTVGITDLDESIGRRLRKQDKKVILVVNKVDHSGKLMDAHVFHKLGLGEPYCISSANGSGTGELLDELVKHIAVTPPEDESGLPRFAVVGRPNVGKSCLINTLVGQERSIVTPLAGTTRDTIHTRYRKFNFDFIIVDTAGLRKKNKVTDNVEFYSVMRSVRAIENSDVCFLLIDATREIESQDINIFRLIQRNRKGVVVVINKWDLVEKDHTTHRMYAKRLTGRIAPFTDVPVVYASALSRQRVYKVLEEGMRVYENRRRRISTAQLNQFLATTVEKLKPPSVKGKAIKIKYVQQLPTATPSFAFYCNLPQYIRDPYKRFLENQLREHFELTGVPVQLFFRNK